MGELLHAMGQLKKARLMLEEALLGQKETLGDNHQHTRNTIGLLDKLPKLSCEFTVYSAEAGKLKLTPDFYAAWCGETAVCGSHAAGHAARMVSL